MEGLASIDRDTIAEDVAVEVDGHEKAVGDSRGNGSIAFAGEARVDCKVRHAAVDLDELEPQAAHGAQPAGVS